MCNLIANDFVEISHGRALTGVDLPSYAVDGQQECRIATASEAKSHGDDSRHPGRSVGHECQPFFQHDQTLRNRVEAMLARWNELVPRTDEKWQRPHQAPRLRPHRGQLQVKSERERSTLKREHPTCRRRKERRRLAVEVWFFATARCCRSFPPASLDSDGQASRLLRVTLVTTRGNVGLSSFSSSLWRRVAGPFLQRAN